MVDSKSRVPVKLRTISQYEKLAAEFQVLRDQELPFKESLARVADKNYVSTSSVANAVLYVRRVKRLKEEDATKS